MSLTRGLMIILLALLSSACTTDGVVANKPLAAGGDQPGYSISDFSTKLDLRSDDLRMYMAFSGGGTRAAALAYGVMQELHDTQVRLNGREQSLLDAVSGISSVSGGSFTSAYYGLYGDRIFVDFEDRFLRRDVERALLRSVLDPLHWFSSHGRTDRAVEYYEKTLFGKATFADLLRKDAPMILINASDLASGARFSFIQEYFDLLCSDLASFPLARAVTASSAVPVVFDPVVVENYGGCRQELPSWLVAARKRVDDDAYRSMVVENDAAFQDTVRHKYAQFVDGGITDNLGLRALLDVIDLSGGVKAYEQDVRIATPRRIAIISVNAAADTPLGIGATNEAPSIEKTISSVTNIELHRYNVSTVEQTQNSLDRWARELSTPERPVTPYFIRLSFEDVPDSELRSFLNEVPTSFSLDTEQVDRLIATGRALLRNNPEFQRLVASLQEQAAPVAPPAATP